MTFIELIEKLDTHYPDQLLSRTLDQIVKGVDPDLGDTLALFLVRELQDTHDPDLSDREQILSAYRVVERAYNELEQVLIAMDEAYGDLSGQ